MSTTTSPLPADDARFAPGGVSEAEQAAYARVVGEEPEPDEDPGTRQRRLRRRRRLLAYGAVPAALALAAAGWMSYLSIMTMRGHSAVEAEDYAAAIGHYEAVATANPWLEQWRVRYNLGTAHLLANQLDEALTELTAALEVAPPAGWVDVTYTDGTSGRVRDPHAPECLVRTNLYAVRTARWVGALEAGDAAAAEAERTAMTQAAGECEVDPPPQPQDEPSQEPSEEPSQQPSEEPSASSSPSPEPSASPSPTPSPTPSTSEQQEELEERNGDANPTPTPGGGSDDRRRW